MLRFAIIGSPVAHSLSPVVHGMAIRLLGIDASYEAIDVSPEGLSAFMAGRAGELDGFNVTLPHKRAIVPHLSATDPVAAQIGAVNTVIRSVDGLRGTNTDIDGVRDSLAPFSERLRGCSVALIGAGGAARAALCAVIAVLKPRAVGIMSRTLSAASGLRQEFFSGHELPGGAWTMNDPEAVAWISSADLIVNTSPVGMAPIVRASPLPTGTRLNPAQVIFDTVYTPRETQLIREAVRAGATPIDGSEMFLRQAAAAFTHWTRLEFPLDAVRPILHQALATLERPRLHLDQ